MQVPVEIVFRHLRKDQKLADLIESECMALEDIESRIVSCRVALEKEQKSDVVSGLYRIRTEVTLPARRRIIIRKEANTNGKYTSLQTLIKEAFEKTGIALERAKERFYIKKKKLVKQRGKA